MEGEVITVATLEMGRMCCSSVSSSSIFGWERASDDSSFRIFLKVRHKHTLLLNTYTHTNTHTHTSKSNSVAHPCDKDAGGISCLIQRDSRRHVAFYFPAFIYNTNEQREIGYL